MDLFKTIGTLETERTRIEEAILVLRRLVASDGGKRRGRPPKWMKQGQEQGRGVVRERVLHVVENGGRRPAPKKRVVSAMARKRMAAAQKRRWAAFRKAS